MTSVCVTGATRRPCTRRARRVPQVASTRLPEPGRDADFAFDVLDARLEVEGELAQLFDLMIVGTFGVAMACGYQKDAIGALKALKDVAHGTPPQSTAPFLSTGNGRPAASTEKKLT